MTDSFEQKIAYSRGVRLGLLKKYTLIIYLLIIYLFTESEWKLSDNFYQIIKSIKIVLTKVNLGIKEDIFLMLYLVQIRKYNPKKWKFRSSEYINRNYLQEYSGLSCNAL